MIISREELWLIIDALDFYSEVPGQSSSGNEETSQIKTLYSQLTELYKTGLEPFTLELKTHATIKNL